MFFKRKSQISLFSLKLNQMFGERSLIQELLFFNLQLSLMEKKDLLRKTVLK